MKNLRLWIPILGVGFVLTDEPRVFEEPIVSLERPVEFYSSLLYHTICTLLFWILIL